jgi:hypothetical protein
MSADKSDIELDSKVRHLETKQRDLETKQTQLDSEIQDLQHRQQGWRVQWRSGAAQARQRTIVVTDENLHAAFLFNPAVE